MNQIISFFQVHWVGTLLVSGYVVLAGFNAMVPPGMDGGGFYGWFYRFSHLLASTPVAAGIEARVNSSPIAQAATKTLQTETVTTTTAK